MRRFDGKSVLVTGGASGIGKATAERLAAEGASLVLADRNLEGAEAAAMAIRSEHGVRTLAMAFDAAHASECYRLVDAAVAALGQLDVLCNIAGIMHWAKTEDLEDEWWDRVLRVNLSAVFHLSKRALPALCNTRGNIVNMASTAGLAGVPYAAAYSASKHGVIGLTLSMAVEFADRGVRVNAICPGAVRTPLIVSSAIPEWADRRHFARLAPKTGKASEPSEIAAAVAYLASAEACNATGTILAIDGGQTAG